MAEPIKFVYIAGPLSSAPMHNVHAAVKTADALVDAGFHPYVPHLTVLWDMISPKDYEEWMKHDLAWIARCDALLRIPGESSGADREVKFALDMGIPVFYSVEHILVFRPDDPPPPPPTPLEKKQRAWEEALKSAADKDPNDKWKRQLEADEKSGFGGA